MGRNRKTFPDKFKKEVAIEALKERNTINEISLRYGISGSMVSAWKKEFINCGFSKETKQMKKELEETKRKVEEAYTELGRAKMEVELLKKKTSL